MAAHEKLSRLHQHIIKEMRTKLSKVDSMDNFDVVEVRASRRDLKM